LLRRALAALVLMLAAAPGARAGEELLDGIAAQVGSDVVLISEVTRVTAPMEDQMRQAGATDRDINMIRVDMLERLIERRLVEQVVRRMELEASDAEVDQAVAAIAADNGITLDQLRESLESHGVTWESYREKLRGEIQRSKILNGMVRSKVRVEDAQVRALYEQRYGSQRQGGEEMHLRHLVVTGGEDLPRTHEQACDQVRAALARIQAGEAFGDLAREISETNPREGGDVGWVHEQDIAKWMADAVRGLEPGQVSAVIEMPFGCNLFQVVERRGFEPLSYEQAEPQLHQELFNKALEEEYERWIEELRRHTYIERKGIFAEAARLGGEETSDPTKVGGGQGLAPLEP
jgi:peptidyl-prolyl cis-trans isomerase SurA